MLVHHAYAHCHGTQGIVVRTHRFFVYENFAKRRVQQAVKQVHQRAFARAVFPHQRENLAFLNGKAHIIVSQYAGKLHAHMFKAYNGRALGHLLHLIPAFAHINPAHGFAGGFQLARGQFYGAVVVARGGVHGGKAF